MPKVTASFTITTIGMAIRTPTMPASCSPISSPKITTSGCTPTADPMMLGTTMWPSSWWIAMKATTTHRAATGDVKRASRVGGTAPRIGPT